MSVVYVLWLTCILECPGRANNLYFSILKLQQILLGKLGNASRIGLLFFHMALHALQGQLRRLLLPPTTYMNKPRDIT